MASTAVKMLTVLRPKGDYLGTILGMSPMALFSLSEAAGAASVTDSVAGFTGTPTDVTFGATTFPDGTRAPSFNGTSSAIDILSAAFATAFTGNNAGTIALWVKPTNEGIWNDATLYALLRLQADSDNYLYITKIAANDLRLYREASNVQRNTGAVVVYTGTAWTHVVVAWNNATGALYHYRNGVELSASGTSTHALVGALASASIGSNQGLVGFWPGYLKYVAIWNRVLTPTEIASLYVSSFTAT